MARLNVDAVVDAEDVREIIGTDLEDSEINNFINMAYVITLPLAGELGDCGGDDALAEIQKLLAAHFMTVRERQPESERIAEASVTWMGKAGEGLTASLYGQQALALDCSGILARAGLKRATFQVWSYEDISYDWED